MKEGEPIPPFALPNQEGKIVAASDFKGQWLVLYFYPKDDTPGCTLQAVEFSQALPEFCALQASVVGVSSDGRESHCRFIAKHHLQHTLLTDTTSFAKACGAWGKKVLFGKEYEGMLRSTFLVDPQGKVSQIWRDVKVKGHAALVKESLKRLQIAD